MADHNPDTDPDGLRLAETSKKGYVRGIDQLATFKVRDIEYVEVDGEAVFEGCIVLGTTQEMNNLIAKVNDLGGADAASEIELLGITRFGERFLWPKGIVPYKINPNLPNQNRVTDAIKHWTDKTKMKFVERTDEEDFVTFRPASGCSSRVGRSTGEQFINLGTNCSTGNTIHEIGHTVGLWHEQSREDRNQHIEIKIENIRETALHNFNQHINDGDDRGNYDYGSIMHYSSFAFSKNGQATIVAKNGAEIGQRTALSDGDIAAVHEAYTKEFAKRANA